MSIRKTGAVTGHVITARDGEVPLGTGEDGRVITAKLEGDQSLAYGPGGWTVSDQQDLDAENEAADQ